MRRAQALAVAGVLLTSVLGTGGSALAAGECAGPGPGGDWPVFGRDAQTTRFQDAEHTIGPDNVGQLEPAWVFPAEGTFQAAPIEADGCVYIGTQSGQIYALNVIDGSLVWRAETGSATTLSYGNGRVFVQSGTVMTALDGATGEVVWQRDVAAHEQHGGGGSPLAFGSYVIVGLNGCGDSGGAAGCPGYYAILGQDTGETVVDGYDTSEADLARGMRGPGFWSHPSYDPEDRYVYFGTANSRSINPENPHSNALLKIDADPGRATFGQIVDFFREEFNPISNYPGVREFCGPAPAGSYLVCTDDDDWPSTAVVYRDSFGRKRVASTHSASGLPVRTYASFAVPRGNYFSIDTDGMDEVWRAPTTGARAAVAAYDGSKMYYSSGFDGSIVAVDKDTGAEVWRATSYGVNVWQHVSAANGVVYSPSGSLGAAVDGGPGMLLALDARDGTPLLERPISLDIGGVALGTVSAGVTIARNTVLIPANAANVIGLAGGSGYLVAYRLPPS